MQLITPEEACRRACISRTTLWRYRKHYTNFPKPLLLNGKHPRFLSEEYDAWLLSFRNSD
jgi:predicted DNA-binding transcriptional regulator AlpA